MNTCRNILFSILILLLFQTVNAQNETSAPEPPEPPEFDLDFEFFHQMSEEDEEELLKNVNSVLKEELKIIKDFNKQKYFELLRESQFKNMKMPFIVKRDKLIHEREKKIFELEVKTEALAAKYKTANSNEKKSIKEELRKELSDLFEQKEERRREEVKELEKELKELQKSLEVRQKNKQVIIERRLQDLLDEEKYLEWE